MLVEGPEREEVVAVAVAVAVKKKRILKKVFREELFSKLCMESKEIPHDIIVRTRDLCARYLGGAWNMISPEQIRIKAITGGMSNLLFFIELPENTQPAGTEPTSCLLRIHCNIDMNRLLNESIVFTMLSERSLGPKLLGVFPGGRFEQYIPSRALLCHELSNPSIARRLGILMARIHMLNVPIAKEPMCVEVADGWLRKLETLYGKMAHKMRVKMVDVDLKKCPDVVTCEVLEKELELLQRCLEKSGSPVLFCHNDLQEGNVLLHNKYRIDRYGHLDANEGDEPLVLIDFEYASYNYRGFDFGNHICEYMLDYGNDKPPFYWIRQERAPTDENLRVLFQAYLDEIDKKGTKKQGCDPWPSGQPHDRELAINELLQEARRFTAVSHLFWCIWSFLLAEESPIEFDYISYGLDRIALYYEDKPRLLEYLQ